MEMDTHVTWPNFVKGFENCNASRAGILPKPRCFRRGKVEPKVVLSLYVMGIFYGVNLRVIPNCGLISPRI